LLRKHMRKMITLNMYSIRTIVYQNCRSDLPANTQYPVRSATHATIKVKTIHYDIRCAVYVEHIKIFPATTTNRTCILNRRSVQSIRGIVRPSLAIVGRGQCNAASRQLICAGSNVTSLDYVAVLDRCLTLAQRGERRRQRAGIAVAAIGSDIECRRQV